MSLPLLRSPIAYHRARNLPRDIEAQTQPLLAHPVILSEERLEQALQSLYRNCGAGVSH